MNMPILKVWLLQIGEPLPLDNTIKLMRTGLLAEELVCRGHEVTWWTAAFDHTSKKWQSIFEREQPVRLKQNYDIIGLKGIGYKRNISWQRYVDHRLVARDFAKKAVSQERPDVIVTSMPPHDLSHAAVTFAQKNKVPVIVDIRDPWPDAFFYGVHPLLQTGLRTALLYDFFMIKKALRKADSLIAATNPLLEWGLRYAQRQRSLSDEIFPLGYKKIRISDQKKLKDRFLSIENLLKNKFIVLYLGALSANYHNPFIVLAAAERLKEQEDVHFIIAGDGELYAPLKTAAEKLSNVTLTGWLNREEIEYVLSYAKVGVCPTTITVNQTSNKIYMYLSAGLPLISSFHGDSKEIVEQRKAGFYYEPNDLDSFVYYLRRLFQEKQLYQQMSINAARTYAELFDADKIYKAYADYVENSALAEKR